MVATVKPFLMFEGSAEAAMELYTGLFPNSAIIRIERWGPGELGKEGTIKSGLISVSGLEVMCFDSPVNHGFTFTPAFSLFVECSSAEELDRIGAQLAEQGNILMPIDNYGFSRRFTWVNDRYGVSWQLNLV